MYVYIFESYPLNMVDSNYFFMTLFSFLCGGILIYLFVYYYSSKLDQLSEFVKYSLFIVSICFFIFSLIHPFYPNFFNDFIPFNLDSIFSDLFNEKRSKDLGSKSFKSILSFEPSNLNNSTQENNSSTVNLNVNTDGFTVLGEGLKAIGKGIEANTGGITAALSGFTTATILKTLPPAQRAGASLGVYTAVVGYQYLGKYMDYTIPLKNQSEETSSRFPGNFDISSVLEISPTDDLLTALTYFLIGSIYPFLTLIINLIINRFNFKEKDFIKSRPKLLRMVTLLSKSSDFYFILLSILILLNLSGALLATYFLKQLLI